MSKPWQDIKKQLQEEINKRLDLSINLSDQQLMEQIEETVFAFSRHTYLTATRKEQMISELFHSFRGLDVLQPLIEDETITEIMVNGPDRIFIERSGQLVDTGLRFESQQKLEDVIQAIVGKVNRVVNESSPIVDARLIDGSRVNIVLPPASLDGPALTIRKFPKSPPTMNDLVQWGALPEEAAQFLIQLVKAKYNVFIGGGTGSGKTTFLNALAQHIPPDERVITIEDSAELQIRGVPNLVRMETRNANTAGKGEITIRDLIRSSLRMRPNRIIVGEVRGAEAMDMLQAMNTGHDGALSTAHANSTADMLSRLETMVISGSDLPIHVVRKQIASALDIMVHLQRLRDRSRKVVEISEVIGMEEGDIVLRPLYSFSLSSENDDRASIGQLRATGEELTHREKLELAGIG